MKDKEARSRIDSLGAQVLGSYGQTMILGGDSLLNRIEKLEYISIKDCPKCKHPVLVQKQVVNHFGATTSITLSDVDTSELTKTFRCLTCGSKFTYSEKCVCRLIEEGE